MNKLPLVHSDQRAIPAELQDYLESPPRHLDAFSMRTTGKLALTNEWMEDKWTFVYFSHSHCLPECQPSLDKMTQLQTAFSSTDFQYLVIGIDSEHETAETLATFLTSQNYSFTAASSSYEEIEKLAKTFIALFLQTNFSNGSYQIEQKHNIFLVDPKGRVYATFDAGFSASNIQSRFLKARLFYARTE
ncbi:MAG: SCO family protein [Piscirickettsiaceae bacterium]|nr:SCO family protein [Piscirickettsiaceae bacterium]